LIARQGSADRGSATVVSVSVLWVAAMLAVAVGTLARGLADGARASVAADAAALAGVARGRTGALEVARANDAELTGYSENGPVVEVRVRVGEASATAWAAPASIH
jgi:hypothetical protein